MQEPTIKLSEIREVVRLVQHWETLPAFPDLDRVLKGIFRGAAAGVSRLGARGRTTTRDRGDARRHSQPIRHRDR